MIYTCPMHPEIEHDYPGQCPKCGMSLEAKTVGAGDEEEQKEIRSLSREFWSALILTIPVLLIAMGHAIPGLEVEAMIPKQIAKWIEFALQPQSFFGLAAFSSHAPGNRSLIAALTCSR